MTSSDPQSAPDPSTSDMLGAALAHGSGLVRGEIDLARAEVQDTLSKAFAAIGTIVGAVVLVLVALKVLAAALVAWLTETGLDAGWAAVLVGGVVAVIAAMLFVRGRRDLELTSPTRSAASVRRDAETLKEASHGK